MSEATAFQRIEHLIRVPEAKPCTLYRMFDAEGVLLYVGISDRPWTRFKLHRFDKPWWIDVASITLEHLADRRTALAAESEAIRSECPAWNVAGGRMTRAMLTEAEYQRLRRANFDNDADWETAVSEHLRSRAR